MTSPDVSAPSRTCLQVPGAPGGLKTHNEESPPPTRPGTAGFRIPSSLQMSGFWKPRHRSLRPSFERSFLVLRGTAASLASVQHARDPGPSLSGSSQRPCRLPLRLRCMRLKAAHCSMMDPRTKVRREEAWKRASKGDGRDFELWAKTKLLVAGTLCALVMARA